MLTGILIGFASAYALSGVLMAIIFSLNLTPKNSFESVDGDAS